MKLLKLTAIFGLLALIAGFVWMGAVTVAPSGSASVGVQGTNGIVVTTNGGFIVVDGAAVTGSGGTNFPPVISLGGGKAAGTNITTGSGIRQSVVIITNASFYLQMTGSPRSGETLKVTVSNFNTTAAIYVTNIAKYTAWGSNITVWPFIDSNSFSVFNLFAATNLANGSPEWILESVDQKLPIGIPGIANSPGILTNNGAGAIGFNSNVTASSVKVLGVAGVDTLDQITVTTGQTTPPFTVFDTNGTSPLVSVYTNGDLRVKGNIDATNSIISQSNIFFQTRGALTNVVTGGTWFKDQTAYTNVGQIATVFTNIGQIVIPSNMLTNNGDVVKGYWKIAQRLAAATTNEFKMVGTNNSGNTYLDTGLQIASNGVIYVYLEAERINANTIAVVASLDWNATQGRLFDRTNGVNRTYVLDTGTNNTFSLMAAAGSTAGTIILTNLSIRATYEPAPF